MIRTLRAGLAAVIDRFPGLRPILHGAWAFAWRPVVRIMLLPFRVHQNRGVAVEDPAAAASSRLPSTPTLRAGAGCCRRADAPASRRP